VRIAWCNSGHIVCAVALYVVCQPLTLCCTVHGHCAVAAVELLQDANSSRPSRHLFNTGCCSRVLCVHLYDNAVPMGASAMLVSIRLLVVALISWSSNCLVWRVGRSAWLEVGRCAICCLCMLQRCMCSPMRQNSVTGADRAAQPRAFQRLWSTRHRYACTVPAG
jgi:hypothetical protein